ncbi:MAG TPA: MmcQ/YjbR family DNA-binding protein [Propionibacteriaceae bacterium]|nr:MmcQ/YjbR family DNA-binding protein [Propionibacteriaceae bacterium]
MSLPDTTEEQWYQTPGYKVAGKGFLRLRTEAEGGLVVFVSDLGEKEALLTGDPDTFFTTPHYDGYTVVLVNLDKIDQDELRELITDSWMIKALPRLRRQ